MSQDAPGRRPWRWRRVGRACGCGSSRRRSWCSERWRQAQKQYTLDRFLGQLDAADLLICDELGYVPFSRGGAELLFRVLRRPLRAGEPAGDEQPAVRASGARCFQGERMTAALLDRLTHRCHIFEMNGESYRFRESMKAKKGRKSG